MPSVSRSRLALVAVCAALLLAPAALAEKGVDDSTGFSGPVRASGGPDMFGYLFFDQDEAECNFDFVDISGTGTALTYTASGMFSADDDGGAEVTLAAPIDFYGTAVTNVVVSTNGYVAMGATLATDSGGDFSNDCPIPAVPDNPPAFPGRLMPYHDDLAADGTGGTTFVQYFADCPRAGEAGSEDCTIIHWQDWGFFGEVDTFDLQAVLYHQSNLIVYQVDDPSGIATGVSTAIGIQDQTATDGLEYLCDNDGGIGAAAAVCYYNPSCIGLGCLGGDIPDSVYDPAIPTQSPVGLLLLVLGLVGAGAWVMARRRSA